MKHDFLPSYDQMLRTIAKMCETYPQPVSYTHLGEIDEAIDALLNAEGQFLLEVTIDPLESTL